MKKALLIFSLVVSFTVNVFSGQNSSAGIRFDLNSSTTGNQNQTSISCPGVNTYIRVDIFVTGASNLDSYELNINYNSSELQYISMSEDNPNTDDQNFLKNGGSYSTTNLIIDATVNGVLNAANSLIGNQGENTPDGEGLLASIRFKALVTCPSGLSFGDVYWYDNNGIKDVCTNKGNNAALPVELSSFTAKSIEEKILLNWKTKTEINNYGFELERSLAKNKVWNKVGFVEGNGNSNSEKEYSFTDKNLNGGSKFIYRLKQIDNDGKFTYSDEVEIEVLPTKYELYQNYPNPFNPVTNFKFQIVNHGLVSLKVYDVLGNEIATIINKELDPGFYNYQWDASYFASGVYFYRIHAGDYVNTKKLLLLK